MSSTQPKQSSSTISDPPMLTLAPEDTDTAFAAGIQFARALAGAATATFTAALAEQVLLIRDAIMTAGYSARKARLANEVFEIGATTEWRRITSPERPMTWGTA